MDENRFDLYCKLFIDTDEDRFRLTTFVAECTYGNVERWNIYNHLMSLNINKNEDFDASLRKTEDDGYLYSRFYLEIEPQVIADQNLYIAAVSKLLQQCWAENYDAVALCDFASVLPRNGGVNK